MTEQKKFSICMVSFLFPPNYSGAARQALTLARALVERGHAVFFVAARLSGEPTRGECEGLRVEEILSRKGRCGVLLYWGSLFLRLIRLRNTYDVIHVHGPNLPNALLGMFGRLLRKKTLVKITLAESDLHFEKSGRVFGKVERWCFRFFSAYVATSTRLVDELAQLGIAKDRVSRIPNGVDTYAFQPIPNDLKDRFRRQLGVDGEMIVTFVGMVSKRKGIDVLVEAWRCVSQESPGARLLLIGPTKGRREHFLDESFHGVLQEMIRGYRLEKSVLLVGEKHNVREYLRATDVFVLPAQFEGMPNVLLEAMACGLPCVATRISGSEDIINHGETGFLVEYGDAASLSDRIITLLTDEKLCKQIGASARRVIEERYSLDRVASDYESLYRRLAHMGPKMQRLARTADVPDSLAGQR